MKLYAVIFKGHPRQLPYSPHPIFTTVCNKRLCIGIGIRKPFLLQLNTYDKKSNYSTTTK